MQIANKQLLFISLIFLTETSFAKNYYVATTGKDSDAPDAGTLSAPFKTIARGSKALAPADTLYIKAGIYNESMNHFSGSQFKFVNGISKTARTRYMAYPGDERKVLLKPQTYQNAVVFISYDVKYVEVGGLILDGTNVQNAVRLARNSSYVYPFGNRIINNEVRFSIGSNISAGGSNEYINNKVHGGGAYGIYVSGPPGLVEGNTIYDCPGYGIHLFDFKPIKDWVIRGNTLYRNGKLYKGSPKPAVILTRGEHQFYNNLIYDNYDVGVQVWGGASETLVANNTIYGNKTYGIEVVPGIQKARLINNIVWANKGIQISDSGTSTVLQKNLTTDPKVVNLDARNFRLRADSLLAINKGATLSEVPFDFTKSHRPAGAYDIGAYEYGSRSTSLLAPTNLRVNE